MDPNNTVCPVCTLYLRPGITLKSHLTSHPKHKVIEALVRLAESEDATEKTADSPTIQSDASSSQVNTSILNQSWNQANFVNMPPNMMPPMGGNHLFIYQQSMSSATPQQNINPLSQQYSVIPTILNPQMMPYVYQQQQLIMSNVPPPLRTLPFQLPPSTTTDGATLEDAECTSSESELEMQIVGDTTETNNEEDVNQVELEELQTLGKVEEKIDIKGELDRQIKLKMYDSAEDNNEMEVVDEIPDPLEPAVSPVRSESGFIMESDKACQTQNMCNMSPRSVTEFGVSFKPFKSICDDR